MSSAIAPLPARKRVDAKQAKEPAGPTLTERADDIVRGTSSDESDRPLKDQPPVDRDTQTYGVLALADLIESDLSLGTGDGQPDGADLGDLIATRRSALEEAVNRQLGAFVNADSFRRVEATWRGIERVVNSTGDRVTVLILNADAAEVRNDFRAAGAIQKSTLFRLAGRRGMYALGAPACHLIILDADLLVTRSDDCALAKHLIELGDRISCGVVAGADPKSLGAADLSAVAQGDPDDIRKFLETPLAAQYRSIRSDPRSRHLALALVRALARPRWNPDGNASNVDYFREADDAPPLWANGAYLTAELLAGAYARHNAPLASVGERNGGVRLGLPYIVTGDPEATVGPLEASLDETVAKAATDAGFITPRQYADGSMVCVYKMPSVYRPPVLLDKAKQADLQVNVDFNVTMLGHQIGHLVREFVTPQLGDDVNFERLTDDLQGWINRIVLVDTRNASRALRQSMPLRSARIVVSPVPGHPDQAHIHVEIQPRIGLGGVCIDLVATAPKDRQVVSD